MKKVLPFTFLDKIYEAEITLKKNTNNHYYYIALTSAELIKNYALYYLFDYSTSSGLTYVSTLQDPKNDIMVETLKTALLKHIESQRKEDYCHS
ncbi:MAG: hypothetical protein JWR18_3763 [Segetibacter sp.]|nr:hypothetical protein [Segetibacter sp.]